MKVFEDIKDLLNRRVSFKGFKISMPLFGSFDFELEDSKTIDERIARLGEIKDDLTGAIQAVDELQKEALTRKSEVDLLRESVQQLEKDKDTVESLLKVPEDSFSRVLSRATSKSRARGIIEGCIIRFVTGALSSLLVWYITK